jgi:hypothetical protein
MASLSPQSTIEELHEQFTGGENRLQARNVEGIRSIFAV